jgi:hypothetical protein
MDKNEAENRKELVVKRLRAVKLKIELLEEDREYWELKIKELDLVINKDNRFLYGL